VEAILADPHVSVDFILDGVHVEPVAVQMAITCKGADKVCLITDANVGAGLPPGRYQSLGSEIEFEYEGAPARMTQNSRFPGALAGSGLTMDKAVQNAVSMLKASIPQAIRMASANPAKVMRLKNKGQIKRGFDADIVLLDQELKVIRTWIKGKCQYHK
jgi:N-acetylglucosamine-6-phosphate deacetylase